MLPFAVTGQAGGYRERFWIGFRDASRDPRLLYGRFSVGGREP